MAMTEQNINSEFSTLSCNRHDTTNKIVARIMTIVEKEYGDPTLSVKKIGEERLFLTPDYVGRLFKRKVGISLNEYINVYRIEKAKILLRENKYKIYEVAKLCGFSNNAKHFSYVFKKLTGVLPRNYE